MLGVIGAVVAFVVVLSGNDGGVYVAAQQPTTLDLDDITNGVLTPNSFNATFTSGDDLLFSNENGDLVLYDIDTSSTTLLISSSSELLQQSQKVVELSPDGLHVVLAYNILPINSFSFAGYYAVVDIVTNNSIEIVPPNLPADSEPYLQNFQWGPSGTSLAFVYENNIYYQSSLDSAPQQITTSGQPNEIYNGVPDYIYEEKVFTSYNALWFSNDGTKLAFATFDDTNVGIMRIPHYVIPGSVTYQYTFHREIRYPKAGTTNPTVSVTLRDLSTGVSNVYSAPTDLDQPILKKVTFVTNDSIALMWTNRVQTTLVVQLCVHGQDTSSQIYQYTESNGWIAAGIPLIFNDLGNSFITILPRAVNRVLYKQIVQVSDNGETTWTSASRTYTPHTVLDILGWTSDDIIWYKATHVDDTAEQHIYSVDEFTNVNCFTCGIRRPDGGACLYNEATISNSGEKIAITCAGPDVPQVYIYDTALDGTRLQVWEDNSEIAKLAANRILPTTIRMTVPIGDGLPEADVQIHVPTDYLSRTNVPLIVYVYAGPDTAQISKQWNVDWGSSLVSRWGIAVARIDGRGSGLKGVANTFTLYRALGSVEVEDQITVTRYLKNNLPWLDSNRTCVLGFSYGGYAASLTLARGGDVFRCAIAIAPVADWRLYDTIYTERHMGVPSDNLGGYQRSSMLTEEVVETYRNKSYFIIQGTADGSVHYQHNMYISRMLQQQDVSFSQMSYTDEDHTVVGIRPHLYRAMEDFLQGHLL